MTRTLHLVTWLETGGLELWLLSLASALKSHGVTIDICCRGKSIGSRAEDFMSLGARVFHVPQKHAGPFAIRHRRGVRQILASGNYSAVHSHCGDLSFAFLEEARRAGVSNRLVFYHSVDPDRIEGPSHNVGRIVRGLKPIWGPYCRRRTLRAATESLGCSVSVARAVGLESNAVLYPGLDLRRFPLRPARPSHAPPRIVTVGTLNAAKNYSAVIDVATLAESRGFRAEFVVAGDGPLFNELHSIVAARGLNNLKLLGKVRDIPALLATCDLALHPSLIEGLSIAILEYQAAGLPVVASNIDQNLEALAPGLRKFAVPPSDVEGMLRAIVELAGSPSDSNVLGSEGRDWVDRCFSIEVCAKTLAGVYRRRTPRK